MDMNNMPQSVELEVTGGGVSELNTVLGGLPSSMDIDASPFEEAEAATPSQLTPPPAPASAPPEGAQEGEELDLIDYLMDVGKGLANGPVNAANETIDLAGTMMQGGEEFDIVQTAAEHGVDMENFGPTRTGAGKFAQDVSTFVAGFMTGGALLKGMKLLQGGTKATIAARGAAKSFYSTTTGFDGHEEMLSNAIQESPTFRNMFTEALAVSKDDSELEGRLKHGLEDLGIGMALEGAIAIVGTYRAGKAATKAAKEKIYADALTRMEQSKKSELFEGILKEETPFGAPAKKGEAYHPDSLIDPKALQDLIGGGAGKASKAESLDDALNILARTSNSAHRVTGASILRSEQGLQFLKHVRDTVTGQEKEPLGALSSSVEELVQRYGINTKPAQEFTEKVLSTGDSAAVAQALDIAKEMETALEFCSKEALRISRKLELNPASVSAQERLDLAILKKNIDGIYKASDELTSGQAARYQWQHSPTNMSEEQIRSFLTREGWNHDNMARIAHDVVINADNKGAIAQAINSLSTGSKLGIFHEFRINNMLSGPPTIAANVGSNMLKSLLMPTERYLQGVFMRDAGLRKEAIDTLYGLHTYFTDSMKLAYRAFKAEEGILEGMGSLGKMESNGAQITYDNIKAMMLDGKPRGTQLTTMQELVASSAGILGPYLRLPSRLLIGTDEMFKQLNFRASLSASLRREAMEGGLKDAKSIDSYVKEQMRLATTGKGSARVSGRYVDDAVKEHLDYARKATWTQDLGEHTYAGGFQRYASEHPMLRVVVPFIKTPANILRDFVAHTPLIGNISKEYRAALAAGGEQAALARARMATGSLMWAGAVGLAMSGTITGSPPSDPKQRKALEATGWQAHSIKIGDSYFSYRRYDPAGMVLGIAADLAIAGQNMTEARYSELTTAAIAALANNVTSKTYMQNIAEVLSYVSEEDAKPEKFLRSQATTLIPFSAATRFTRQHMTGDDDPMREVRSILDAVMNTVPGFHDDLPAKRNWITGDPIDYRLMPRDKQDPVLDEMNTMAEAVNGPPAYTLHGVSLSAAQYSRLTELHGTITINGKTMQEALGELFSSEQYDIDRLRLADPPEGKDQSPRAMMIKRVVKAFREEAQDRLIDETPELAQDIRKSDYQRQMTKRGQMTKANHHELLQALVDDL